MSSSSGSGSAIRVDVLVSSSAILSVSYSVFSLFSISEDVSWVGSYVSVLSG